MSKPKHTPGPWEVTGNTRFGVRAGHHGVGMVAELVAEGAAFDAVAANARLIAASPELLEALRAYVSGSYADAECGARACDCANCTRARAAIRKAEGES